MSLFPAHVSKLPEELVSGGCQLGLVEIAGCSLDTFKNVDPTNYTILSRFGECMDSVKYYPGSGTIVMDCKNYSLVVGKFQQEFLPNVAKDLAMNQTEAYGAVQEFFCNKNVMVQPTGIQGKVYNLMRGIQTYTPLASMTQAVTTAKTLGLTGTKIVTSAPLTCVGATYIGSIFFAYVGTVAGNNTFGVVCNTTSYVLSRPMRGVEMVLNGLILTPISNTIGLPLILNGTSELTAGMGIHVSEYGKIAFAFERMINSNLVQKIKKVYHTLRD